MSPGPVDSPLAAHSRLSADGQNSAPANDANAAGGAATRIRAAGAGVADTASAAAATGTDESGTSGTPVSSSARESRLASDGGQLSTSSLQILLSAHPLSGEVAVLVRWFESLADQERAAVATALIERCSPAQAPLIASAADNLRAAQVPKVPTGTSSRQELFSQFQAAMDSADHLDPGAERRKSSATGLAPGSPSIRGYRALPKTGSAVSGSPFGMNSFMTPVGGDLYSQAFMPFSGGSRQFTPWSLSQEIGRPKSAAEAPNNGAGAAPGTPGKFSPYKVQNPTWNTTAGPAPGNSAVGQGPGSAAGSAPGSAAGSARVIGSSREGLDKHGPWGPIRHSSATPSGTPANAAAPSVIGRPASSNSSTGPNSQSAPGLRPGSAATRTSAAPGRVPGLAPFVPGSSIAAVAAAQQANPPQQHAIQETQVQAASPSSVTAGTPSASNASGSPGQRWARPSFAPESPTLSPFGTSKRAVDYTDPVLLQDVGAWLRSLRLHKYTDNLSGMAWQDVIRLSEEDLEARGVNALGARRKMLKMFESIRIAQESGPSTK